MTCGGGEGQMLRKNKEVYRVHVYKFMTSVMSPKLRWHYAAILDRTTSVQPASPPKLLPLMVQLNQICVHMCDVKAVIEEPKLFLWWLYCTIV